MKWEENNPEQVKVNRKKTNSKPERIEYLTNLSNQRREEGKYAEWARTESGKASGRKSSEKRKVKNHIITKNEWISCKNYFKDEDGDWACIYCGKKAKFHFKKYKGELKLYDLDKEHVDDKGSADLDNCVPSCTSCNSSKHTSTLDEWYNSSNPKFEQWRYDKIIKWINEDYKQYIEVKKPKGKYVRKKTL